MKRVILTVAAHSGTPDWEVKTAFESADVDQNGLLNRGEFIAYAEAKAAEGDESYAVLVASGDCDRAFAERDLNDDGALDRTELGEMDDAGAEAWEPANDMTSKE